MSLVRKKPPVGEKNSPRTERLLLEAKALLKNIQSCQDGEAVVLTQDLEALEAAVGAFDPGFEAVYGRRQEAQVG